MKLFKDETGVSLLEVMVTIVLLVFFLSLTIGLFQSIAKTSAVQGEKVEIQQQANNMVEKIRSISNTPRIYEQAGYMGKYVGEEWQNTQIVKVLRPDEGIGWTEAGITEAGTNTIGLTAITDTMNSFTEVFSIDNPDIKIKILQEKNENDETKTVYSTSNYRDTFSIQSTSKILFYKNEINFANYYNKSTGKWDEELLSHSNIVYFREMTVQYRDDAKSKGDIPGNGRW
ncbi:type II secretion system protein [Enterococcus faecalis]|uniref:PilW family protein n=1 Tax=Enterococcus faecalis TaxID=1351 RepID=UPI0019D8048F|nr:type II secretion system protein [Enterococcus faecalis]EGO6705172.1 type II secretion system protein [Enterococcus faecalis]